MHATSSYYVCVILASSMHPTVRNQSVNVWHPAMTQNTNYEFWRFLPCQQALIAQLGERQTEDLKVASSILAQGNFFVLQTSSYLLASTFYDHELRKTVKALFYVCVR